MPDTTAQDQVLAVVVAFDPAEGQLLRLVQALDAQTGGGVIVHNGSALAEADQVFAAHRFEVLHLGQNLGVASALNHGLRWCAARGVGYALTMDQDSLPAPDMVAQLRLAAQVLQDGGARVAAVGPQSLESKNARPAPFLLPVEGRRHSQVLTPGQTLAVDHLISSGCLLSLAAWRDVGPYLDALFIDYVDIEWCLRARARDWQVFGVGSALLQHALGDAVRSVGRRNFPWHSASRHYYLFRNAILLQRLPHISAAWKRADRLLLLKRFVLIAWCAPWGAGHVPAMLRGLWDGLRGRAGPSERNF